MMMKLSCLERKLRRLANGFSLVAVRRRPPQPLHCALCTSRHLLDAKCSLAAYFFRSPTCTRPSCASPGSLHLFASHVQITCVAAQVFARCIICSTNALQILSFVRFLPIVHTHSNTRLRTRRFSSISSWKLSSSRHN